MLPAGHFAGAPQAVQYRSRSLNYWTNTLLTKAGLRTDESLTNWAAGGYNTVSSEVFPVDANANYARRTRWLWNNRLQLDYGFIYSADKPFIQKSDDRIYLESLNGAIRLPRISIILRSFSYQIPVQQQLCISGAENRWYSRDPSQDPLRLDGLLRLLKSGLMSPAYTDLGSRYRLGPFNKWLTVNVAPLTGGFVIVHNECLRPTYSMSLRNLKGQEKIDYDAAVAKTYANAIEKGEAIGQYYRGAKFEFGAKVTADAKIQVNDNFKYSTQLVLFSDYLDHPENLRVNWDNRFDWKLAKYFSMTITTNMIYDDKVYIVQDKDVDKYPNGRRRIQFKESLSFGFAYTIASKKK
jgi:hypothetical protein